MANDPIRGHVTIEKNRKSLKFFQTLAALTLIFGVVLIWQGAGQPADAAIGPNKTLTNGIFTTVGGLAWLLVTKLLMWWHHG
jgi:hypothetical protein